MMRKKIACFKILMLLVTLIGLGCSSEGGSSFYGEEGCTQTPTFPAQVGSLFAEFSENTASGDCLESMSGVLTLEHQNLPGTKAFRSFGTGLNFEHILTGFPDGRAKSGFTPREGKFPLTVLPDFDGITLNRSALDEPWRIRSNIRYKIVPPHYIDFVFEVEFLDASYFHPHAAFFFASYMHWVEDTEINFLGFPDDSSPEQWVRTRPNELETGENYIPMGSTGVTYDPDAPFLVGLSFKSEEWPKISKPFYYGLAGNDSVYGIMFDQLYTPESELHFTVMRWELEQRPSPAWDFIWVVKNPVNGQRARLQGRLIFKPFVSREDIQAEYNIWQLGLQ